MATGAAARAARLFESAARAPGLVELRTYTVRCEHVPAYLAATGSEAFAVRRAASPLLGFFATELGGTLNTFVHLWGYASLDHRTDVRAALAADPAFHAYFDAARPWLAEQHAIITVPWRFEPPPDLPANTAPRKYALAAAPPGAEVKGAVEGACSLVATLQETVGRAPGTTYGLYAAESFAELHTALAGSPAAAAGLSLLQPTPFSPMQ